MLITWLGHAGVRIETGSRTIYVDPSVDPFVMQKHKKADLILITTADFDHFSMECVRSLVGDQGFIIGTTEAAALVHGVSPVRIGETREFEWCSVRVMPTKPWGRNRKNSIVGFLLIVDGKTIYIPGDTQYVQEMSGVRPDVLLLPVGGTYSATAREAITWLKFIEPKLVIPIHYGRLDGTIDDAKELLALTPLSQRKRIKILQENQTMDIDAALKEVLTIS